MIQNKENLIVLPKILGNIFHQHQTNKLICEYCKQESKKLTQCSMYLLCDNCINESNK